MTDTRAITPQDIQIFPSRELGIIWEDDHTSIFPCYELRCACNCAKCVDEVSGVKLLDDEGVIRSINAREIHGVGRSDRDNQDLGCELKNLNEDDSGRGSHRPHRLAAWWTHRDGNT